MEQLELQVVLDATGWENRFPTAKVWIDDQLIFTDQITTSTNVDWSGELDDGVHTFVIEMSGKGDRDTVMTSSGTIDKDVLLHIKKFTIDEIDVGMLLWNNSEYWPDYEANPYAPKGPLTQVVDLGWNGRWEFKFEVPTYIWLLENL